MSYLLEITHPLHQNISCSLEYMPKRLVKETPEEAAQLFREEISAKRFDLGAAVESLDKGVILSEVSRETGRTVTAKRIEDSCAICKRDCGKRDPGWSLVSAGFLCPDCTVAVCPDDALPVEHGAVV